MALTFEQKKQLKTDILIVLAKKKYPRTYLEIAKRFGVSRQYVTKLKTEMLKKPTLFQKREDKQEIERILGSSVPLA